MTRTALEAAIGVLAVAGLVSLAYCRGQAASRADAADARALVSGRAALAAEQRRQADSARWAEEAAALRRDSTRAAHSLAAARHATDSLLTLPVAGPAPAPSNTTPAPPPGELRDAILRERAACDLSIRTCEQMRHAAELRAAAADTSARRLAAAVDTLTQRLEARRPHLVTLRRIRKAVGLTGCVVAGIGVGQGEASTATLAGGAACLLELLF